DIKRKRMELAVGEHDPRRFLGENIIYFMTLHLRCPNETLRELVDLTWKKSVRYWSIFARLPLYGQMSLIQHRVLHNAVRARDGQTAEEADRLILERALHTIVETFEHR
ncbi:MAG TPA: FCD domain-containing protein, partial [Caldimonas sp.]|nr:FCD domain-containing protein [Caldimonas sp.]